MSHLDRLSTLIAQFKIRCERVQAPDLGNVALMHTAQGGRQLQLFLQPCDDPDVPESAFLGLRVDIGGEQNPLFQALPCRLIADLDNAPDIETLTNLIVLERSGPRCGGEAALNRLCEVLVINLLRLQIEQNNAGTGLLAGLAHPKLSRALVAIHDAPGKLWKVDDLSLEAGMSRSQFMAEFQAVVGTTPIAYLRQWRMTLARAALLGGDRVKDVAVRFGYGSGDAFCRAFSTMYNIAPTELVRDGAANS